MYCQKCGKEVDDEAVVCIHCGCATGRGDLRDTQNVTTSGVLVIGSILFPIIGFIVGIVYLCSNNPSKKHAGSVYLVTAVVTVVLCLFVSSIMAVI